ncbi:hypothetical protein LSTR_LSTR008888 [Laodelphax striatellus]|uniref:Uncharacterized protein n=1 Tax=Laodelphax striatellus TaxID=195883 RepID=A0A482WLF2_LAOST|nr:hypothetical protein LSTR_LSTR008888 [Laodelphax striatellus]
MVGFKRENTHVSCTPAEAAVTLLLHAADNTPQPGEARCRDAPSEGHERLQLMLTPLCHYAPIFHTTSKWETKFPTRTPAG